MPEPARIPAAPPVDPVLSQLREQITETDRRIVEIVNRRLELVARIRRYKADRGLPFLDPAREEWMLRYLTRANRGPLSDEGLAALYRQVLDLTKRELV